MDVVCIRCGDATNVTVDLDDGDTLRCQECEESFTVGEVEAVVECWAKLLPWLRLHPARQMKCETVS